MPVVPNLDKETARYAAGTKQLRSLMTTLRVSLLRIEMWPDKRPSWADI